MYPRRMTLEDRRREALIKKVVSARSEFETRQDAVESARDDYHTAVRALHDAGMSIRHIAAELGLSHQRVHQIVSPTTETKGSRWKKAAGAASAFILVAGGLGIYLTSLPDDRRPTPSASAEKSVVQVPNIVGMKHAKATLMLTAAGLEVVLEETKNAKSGVVVEQSPQPGYEIEKGSAVLLMIGTL